MTISGKRTANTALILTEALPYIRQFQNAIVVVKLGGSTMADKTLVQNFAKDLVLIKLIGMNPVVVHGGGPQISETLSRFGVKSRFEDGMRVTDAATMEVVQMVLAGQINQNIVSHINQNGGTAVGLTGKDGTLIKARKLRPEKAAEERAFKIDLGQVGEVVKINKKVLDVMFAGDFIPVIAPIGFDEEGMSYNINADLVASAIAAELKAEKLVLLTDTVGVLDNEGHLYSTLSEQEADALIRQGIIRGGMLPKVQCALKAVAGGAHCAHIIDGRVVNALLVEMLTNEGVGTLIGASE